MLTNENFKEKLQQEKFSLLLICDGCPNCTIMTPMIHAMKEKFNVLSIYVMEASEQNNAINKHYEVEAAPTLLFLHKGELVSKIRGYQPPEILEIFLDCKISELS